MTAFDPCGFQSAKFQKSELSETPEEIDLGVLEFQTAGKDHVSDKE